MTYTNQRIQHLERENDELRQTIDLMRRLIDAKLAQETPRTFGAVWSGTPADYYANSGSIHQELAREVSMQALVDEYRRIPRGNVVETTESGAKSSDSDEIDP